MKHTPEPWLNDTMPYNMSHEKHHLSKQDYERARACVNACAGIDSEYLKKVKLAEQIANANAANYYKDLLKRFYSAYKNARNARPDGNGAEQFNLRQRIAEIEAAIMEGLL